MRAEKRQPSGWSVRTSALALVHRYVVCVAGAGVDLAWTGDFELGVFHHFHPLGHPARGTGYDKHDGKGVGWYAEGFVDEARVEVHVGVELAAGEVVVVERALLQLDGDVQERALFVGGLEDFVEVAAVAPASRGLCRAGCARAGCGAVLVLRGSPGQ